MLDIKPLRYFLALAETRNFHRAAERLHMSQPPLSRRIAALEREVGTPLFARGGRQVTLTPAGAAFHAEAVAILAALQRAQALARATAAGSSGRLRIGFTMCAAHSVVPGWVRAMRAAWPQVALELREIVSDELPDRLAAGEIDLAVMFDQRARAGLARRLVLSEPMCVALPRSHPRARARRLRITDLRDDLFAMTAQDAGSRLHAEVLDFCRRHGFEPKVSFEVRLQQTMLGLVNDAHCVALVPDSMRRVAMQDIVFKRLDDAPAVDLYLAWSEGNRNPCLPGFFSACAIPA
ncbi:LysR family transcriptional regulator [uncultured Massilia sp.]|uniref:LysR substrate-binding domain-containing protein n=1 Tax=uncultured Massilia sp. TaxID=169973 RepID=UPI0025F76647|nr:LysR family transcriptional regulator [uncultured Massilia sp.]